MPDSHLEMDFEDRVSGFHPIGGFPMEDECGDDPLSGGYYASRYESEEDDDFDPEAEDAELADRERDALLADEDEPPQDRLYV